MVVLVAAVVPETSRLQLLHVHLCVRRCCQFVLINLLLGPSLVSSEETQDKGGNSSLDLSPLFLCICSLINTNVTYSWSESHIQTWAYMLTFFSKGRLKNKLKGKRSSSWISHSWFSAGDGTHGEILISWIPEHMRLGYNMFNSPRACKQSVDLKSLHQTVITVC